MKRGVGRAAVIGAVVAVAALAVSAIAFGVLAYLEHSQDPLNAILVIAAAPDPESGDCAPIAFTVDARSGRVRTLDTRMQVTVPGSSAQNARDAFTYGGGEATARALAGQTAGITLEWVVLPSALWSEMIDEAGGVTVDVPEAFTAYADGELTVMEAGVRRLTGAESVALVSASDYFADVTDRRRATRLVERALAKVVTSGDALNAAVSDGRAPASVEAERVPIFDK